MKLGYTIIYVPNVLASIEFYERAFVMWPTARGSKLIASMERFLSRG